jgi:DNA-binding CsgD family transcriptional regulator
MLAGRGFDHAETAVLRAAAGAALDRGATETAARYLRAALLNHLEQGTERAQLLVALATAERSADPGAAARHVMMALPQLPATEERATAALSVPPTLAAAEPVLVGTVRAAWAETATHDREGRHHQLSARLAARMRLLVLHDHLAGLPAEPLTGLASGAEVDDLLGSAAGRELLAVRAYAAALAGSRPSAEVSGLLARVLAREPATPAHAHTALPVLVPVAVAADAVPELAAWLELVGREARRTGSAGERALLDAEVAVLHAATGRLGLAQETAAAALAAAGPDWPEVTALAVTALTSVALRTQDAELAGQVLAHAPPSSDPRLAASATMLRGMTDALAGDWATALDRFLDCGHRLRRVGWTGAADPPWRAWAVAAHRALGERDAAVALAAVEDRVATAWGSPGARGRALLLRASLADDSADADTLVHEAAQVLRDSVDRLGLAAALTVLGRGRSDNATIAEGERIAAECGTYWGAEDSPYGGPVPRLRRSAHVPLTRTEDTVVALVRKGWTNQRIADDLGVTRRAVEKTLTGAYRKLGVPGRAALLHGPEQRE